MRPVRVRPTTLAAAALLVLTAVLPFPAASVAAPSAPATALSAAPTSDSPLPDEPAAVGASPPRASVATPRAGLGPDSTTGGNGTLRIVAAYPDPLAAEDRGEHVVLSVPPGADLDGATLSDGEARIPLENVTARGRVALAARPGAVDGTDATVLRAPDLSLANGGERLVLRRDGRVLDRAVYREAEPGHRATWDGRRIEWTHAGATDRPVVTARGGAVRAFVLPDAPGPPLAPIRTADRRVLLAGYTLTSDRVADALVAARERGADVRVLLEGEPVGGRTARGARTLDRLAAAGVEVRVIGGPAARYDYHHAKYAVADGRAVVLTENWKPAGVGGADSRGWGVATSQAPIVRGLAATFRADAGWRDARPWERFRRGRRFEAGGRANGSYPARHTPATVPTNRTELVVAPDNARGALTGVLDRANRSVDVIQMTVGWEGALSRSLRRAARRGVSVRLLLSDAWYVREDNRKLAERFREWAAEAGADLTVRLADPAGYGKIHAKGAVVDDRTVVVGSLNWNAAATTENREVVLVLHGTAAADYFGDVFDGDWGGGDGPSLPVGVALAVAGVAVVAGLAATRLYRD